MYQTKRILIWLICTLTLSPVFAQETDYERIAGKARRFFDNQEWASAYAMFLLMLEQEPQRPATYAGAIVSDIMAGHEQSGLDMVTRSMSNDVPLDSLLADVRTTSFSIGKGDLYEHFLLDIQKSFPWLSRVADNYLMKYYAFRQNGPELVRYATTMLDGLPDNLSFMRMLAHGLMLSGDTVGAAHTWLKIAELYPHDYDTVLDLANYYDSIGDASQTLIWMKKADAIRPTPYVTAKIAQLGAQHP